MEIIDLTYRKVEPDDTFQYHCFRCGECCHNVKDAIMLTSLDLFLLARHLDLRMDEIVGEYTDPVYISEDSYPFLMLKTKPHGDACIFYKNGCSVQPAKPLPCRLYPLNIEPGNHHGLGYCIVSQKPHHYTGETHRVTDWMGQNLTPDDRRFMIGWFKQAGRLGRAMRRIRQMPGGKESLKALLTPAIWLMYLFYETREDFWPQYERNMAQLEKDFASAASDS